MRARVYKVTGPLTDVGVADPTILRAAAVLARRGFRVTSVFRADGSSHQTGRSLDVAPLVYQSGGLGLGIASEVFHLLQEATGTAFVVVSERDHVHVELPGRYSPGYGKLVGPPTRPRISWGSN